MWYRGKSYSSCGDWFCRGTKGINSRGAQVRFRTNAVLRGMRATAATAIDDTAGGIVTKCRTPCRELGMAPRTKVALFPSTKADTLDTTVDEGCLLTSNSEKIWTRVSLNHAEREPPGSCPNIRKVLVCNPDKGQTFAYGARA